MQKRIIGDSRPNKASSMTEPLNLEALADVEVSSEAKEHAIEAALLPGFSGGWRAGIPGPQVIRLLFKQAQPVQSIQLDFLESAIARTQEYVLRISADRGQSFREILRQQWNFNPQGCTAESEQHVVDLPAVSIIELHITPDINNSSAFASLETMRVF
ncbi:carbohydrate-binding protein [Methylomonas sp. TEB]|uniref:carbohydrate-binding protein n=1 Tax=Methylomonas sp. TEB TaxID=3398229 RepID=UPI0039F5C852